MITIGLTGGVGAGKSSVAALLAERGALVIDADRLAREVVEPGTPGLAAVVEAFGPDVLTPEGALDRPALAARVFADDAARARLNGIVHPLVGRAFRDRVADAPADAVVVHDVPLLVENGLAPAYDVVLIVMATEATRVERLAGRGMAEADARARMAAQATDEQRRAAADVLIGNDGTSEELAAAVAGFWRTHIEPRLP